MTRTAEQLMNLRSLTNWLEQKPRMGMYRYQQTSNCLLARYYKANGFPNVRVGINILSPDGCRYINAIDIPDEIHEVAYGGTRLFRTFGGALKRARRALNAETQEYALQEAGAR